MWLFVGCNDGCTHAITGCKLRHEDLSLAYFWHCLSEHHLQSESRQSA
jgi:hypothetical protein